MSVPTLGSIHEGGELGYVLSHAFGAAFDNPDLLVVAVIGDGEAETGPFEGAWKSIKFLNPMRDGAVLPILHVNGYKTSDPTVLDREEDEEIKQLLAGHGYDPYLVSGTDPIAVHHAFARTLDQCYQQIHHLQHHARTNGLTKRPLWPVILPRTPNGSTQRTSLPGLARRLSANWSPRLLCFL